MHPDITSYHLTLSEVDRDICDLLARKIDSILPASESKVWHAHPVWFLDGNPIVGYSKLKGGVRLLFWSGQSFGEQGLKHEGKFKAAEVSYTQLNEVNTDDLHRWLEKAKSIQWDYQHIVKRKGVLIKRTGFGD